MRLEPAGIENGENCHIELFIWYCPFEYTESWPNPSEETTECHKLRMQSPCHLILVLLLPRSTAGSYPLQYVLSVLVELELGNYDFGGRDA
jgi:hypothetical protein